MIKNSKLGLYLIILGEFLYFLYKFLSPNMTGNVGDFFSGLMLGISIGINLLGIIISVASLNKKD